MRRFLRTVADRFPRLTMFGVRHPWLTGATALLAVAAIVAAAVWVPRLFTECGPGMSEGSRGACVGVDLAGTSFRSSEPAQMSALEAEIRASNRTVSGDYVSVVLFQDMSPVSGVDTRQYTDLYPDIEGALAGAWRANHTAAVQGSLPKVKLFLANMGSQYADWSKAVDLIIKNAAAHRIVSVIGLGQSTDNTRAAATRLTKEAHLPVIGATVTGDSMNFAPDGSLNTGFFRTSPTNTSTVLAAAHYIAAIEPNQSRVAIVQDNAAGDDYTQTLGTRADQDMPAAHRFPYTSPTAIPHGLRRDELLKNQFAYLDQNVCSAGSSVVYFAGRGSDLGAFAQVWTQSGTPCANGRLTIVTGNDGGAALNEPTLRQALLGGHVRVLFTSPASPDEWGPCDGNPEQAAYDTFQAVFTGKPDVCTGQSVRADDGAAPLTFALPDLRSGEAILAHDAMVVAVTAARRDAGGTVSTVLRAPMSQVGFIEEMRCANAIPGASGRIAFSPDQSQYGNPVDKRVPIVEIHPDGAITTVWNKAPTQTPC